MVNFRYHLVSLIAVFLALAVGVVLGAGPLQNAITRDQEKAAAQAEQAEVEAALADASAVADQGEVFAASVGDQVLPETLAGSRVALLVLPGVTGAEIEPVVASLETAGATVAAEVTVTDAFVSPDQNTYRETLASPVSGHLTGRPADGEASSVLAAGIVEVLTLQGAEPQLVAEMLTDEGAPILDGATLPEEPVDAIVLLGPSAQASDEGEGEATEDAAESGQSGVETVGATAQSGGSGDIPPMTTKAWLALASAVAGSDAKSVAVGQSVNPGDFILVLREGDSPVATVDQGGTAMAALNASLVLVSGTQGSFGQQEGAATVLAPLP